MRVADSEREENVSGYRISKVLAQVVCLSLLGGENALGSGNNFKRTNWEVFVRSRQRGAIWSHLPAKRSHFDKLKSRRSLKGSCQKQTSS